MNTNNPMIFVKLIELTHFFKGGNDKSYEA